jgi:putative oxidoreductase
MTSLYPYVIPFVSSFRHRSVLLVATFTVHLAYGFSSIKLLAVTPTGAQFGPPGYEVDLFELIVWFANL